MYSVVRLKRLLEKKRRALLMPKTELADYEEEYIELLSRIESERRKLKIDDDTVNSWLCRVEEKYKDEEVIWCIDNGYVDYEPVKRMVDTIIRCSKNGDIEDLKYYRDKLLSEWKKVNNAAHENHQLTL